MKKRLLLLICPIVLLVAAAGVYFWLNRDLVFDVSAKSWERNGEFFLGTYTVDVIDNSGFVPKNEQEFIQQVESNSAFIGKRNYPYLGISDNECRMFYYNDGIYALMKWNDTVYELLPCKTDFSTYNNEARDYAYPSPGDFYPKWEKNCYTLDNDYWDFDYVFGSFEESCEQFYGYFSEAVVSIDSENQVIRCHPYCYNTEQLDSDKWVVIDFVNKTVGFDFGEEE